jgi:hypothetical protein
MNPKRSRGVACSALLGGGFGVLNNIINGLQYLVVVVNINLGNDCNQILKPLLALSGSKVPAYNLSRCQKLGSAISEYRDVMLKSGAAWVHVKPVNLVPPSVHEGEKISAAVFRRALGRVISLQLLGMESPSVSEPSGSQPTGDRQTDDIRISHVLVYLLLLAVSGGAAYHIGRTQPPNVSSSATPEVKP